ncbi:MAG: hypothetical protein JST67_09865 [Bacteroidetes bacterium]|nr:hypothetical protein [Bacteroidota bacterium]
MLSKLTLTVEKDIIELAKVYAHEKGRSLSDVIENYLKVLVQKNQDKEEVPPSVKKLIGSMKAPKNFDYKKEFERAITKKYTK